MDTSIQHIFPCAKHDESYCFDAMRVGPGRQRGQDRAAGQPARARQAAAEKPAYYLDATKPLIELSTGSGRQGRAALTVKLTKTSVSQFTPVVSPADSGMTHEVAKTWDALKNLAKMFEHVNALNARHPNSPRRFPKGAVAVKAAADNSPTKGNLNSLISAAEARGHHDIWSETSPGSVLLLPTGQSTAAVADVMDVKYDSTTEVVSLALDVVHDPHTISEFEAHGKQSLDTDAAHYHFATAPGVKVDAAGLLKSLQEADFQVDGLHIFAKTGLLFPVSLSCATVTMISNATAQLQVNDIVTITAVVDVSQCANPSLSPSTDLGLQLVGNASWVDSSRGASSQENSSSGDAHLMASTLAQDQIAFLDNIPNTGNSGTATFQVDGNGPIIVQPFSLVASSGGQNGGFNGPVLIFTTDAPCQTCNTTCNTTEGGGQPGPPVARLLLSPAKAYRHVHDPITVTALALDASSAPVPGAQVVLATYGDCEPWINQANATTIAAGKATFTFKPTEPGAVSVVAATVNTQGLPVVSNPSHVIFFDEHHDIDEREEDYYKSGHEHHDDDYYHQRGADGYANTATNLALQRLGAKASIYNN